MKTKLPKHHAPPGVRQRANSLRQEMTPAEIKLWHRLRNRQLFDLKFRRQHPLHRFILDFCCHEHLLVVEVDGGIHEFQKEYDEARTQQLEQHGYNVLRFKNEEVIFNIEGVLGEIARVCGRAV